MARTRQKRKARQRQQQQQQQATRRDATAKEQPTNPAEAAVIQHADALETADELEEIARGEEPGVESPPADVADVPDVADDGDGDGAVAAPPKRRERKPAREERKPARQEKRRERKPAAKKEARQRGRIANFFVQVWAELRRVQWPDRSQVTQATGVVVVFCFIAGAFLAFWDFVFGKLVTSLL
jgi:preprotein translocase SecE subunit